MRIETLKEELRKVTEPGRTRYGNIRHKLEDIIVIGLCSVICGGEDFVDMEEFGKKREEFLRKFPELPNGIPDSDTFRRLFERLNPSELSSCLIIVVPMSRTKKVEKSDMVKGQRSKIEVRSIDLYILRGVRFPGRDV